MTGSGWFTLQWKLKECRRRLRAWKTANNFNSIAKMQKLQNQLSMVFEAKDFDGEEYRRLENSLKEVCKEEEQYWRDKAGVDWLKFGNNNTSYFHATTVQMRAQNRIRGFEAADGVWKEGESEVESVVLDYFSQIFTSSSLSGFNAVLNCGPQQIIPSMNAQLTHPVSAEEG